MAAPREGDVYKTVTLHGKRFVIRYGYYADYERKDGNDPIPIYPDFLTDPAYTDEGYPFVTQMQDLCEYGESPQKEAYCIDCPYFSPGNDLIGICRCENRRKNNSTILRKGRTP